MKTVISTTAAPGAIGPYSQAIEANGFVFISGQLAIDPATGEFSDAYVDTGLDSNDSGGLGGFSGGKVQ